MKQRDLALILVIVFISGIASFLLSNFVIANPKNLKEQVEVVEPITSEFIQPDSRYFSNKSKNPTQTIKIGENLNPQPFDSVD